MMRWLVGALVTVMLLGADGASAAPTSVRTGEVVQGEELDRALQVALDEVGTPGVSASIVFADGRRWSGVAGMADIETKRRVKESTPFATRTGLSGSLASTAGDLATWGDALFRGDVLQPRSLDEMLDFEATADLPCPLIHNASPTTRVRTTARHGPRTASGSRSPVTSGIVSTSS